MKQQTLLLLLFLLSVLVLVSCHDHPAEGGEQEWPDLIVLKSKVLTEADGHSFRDLNGNGKLDVYEDPRQPLETRVDDLLGQMTPEEKAGMMFINGAPVAADGDPASTEGVRGPSARMPTILEHIGTRKMNHFNLWDIPADPQILAQWYNRVQQFAEQSRLGIPVTIASDPRHHLGKNVIGMAATGFTQFCEMTGFAALVMCSWYATLRM